MPVNIDLDSKTPQELRKLLDNVKVSNIPISEKDFWVQRIQVRLGIVTRDVGKERKILLEIEAGMADISDANS